MRYTICLIALVFAALLYEEKGMPVLASAIALLAVWEAFIWPWWSSYQIRRRIRQARRREEDGVTQADMDKMVPGLRRQWSQWRYGTNEPKDALASTVLSALELNLPVEDAKMVVAALRRKLLPADEASAS